MARTFMRRWFSGGPDDDPAAISAYNAMTTAFLQTDRLLADIEDGVAAARDTDPAGTVTAQWGPVREMHAQATSTYLQLQRPEPDSPYQPAAVYQDCTRALEQVSAEMTAFRDRFGEKLARARAARQIAVGAVQQARVAANQAVTALDRPESLPFLQYPSVMAAVDVLAAQVRKLDTVTDTAHQREVAAAVTDAAAAVHAALAAAPGRGTEAQNAVRSISTRISAVATRAEQMGPTRSALLREFSAACSNDLVDNDRVAAAAAASAEQQLHAARAEITAGRPEAALAHCANAREHLRDADDAVDAVTDRLRSLREVRENPGQVADRVRFRLRDAQQLAMQRELVAEWGSVLDAQVDRIDRACAALEGVHPDYWTYMSDLEAIDRFIIGVVDRMRGRG
ncbi:hypothetical protein P9990_26140 (plasmid) [Prescottella equi]|uniref:hypothetical protein n=1 Tax=Rhodococcus hoagii TaxID=43767 RepID=UPI002578D98F|nr:hypothetical protein [Prescottella equi]WJJ14301.1 hypothetical protein P9990_26140 [Prescottella equi]